MSVDIGRIEAFYEGYVRDTGTLVGWTDDRYAGMAYRLATGWGAQDWGAVQGVLDVGSGGAGLLCHLRASCGYRGRYVGVEVLERFHAAALARFSGDPLAALHRAEFLAWDPGPGRFDWVFSLGSLCVRQAEHGEHDGAMLGKMVDLARRGVVVCLNDRRRMPEGWERQDPGLMAHDVGDFAARARETPGVRRVAKRRFPKWEGPGVVLCVEVG